MPQPLRRSTDFPKRHADDATARAVSAAIAAPGQQSYGALHEQADCERLQIEDEAAGERHPRRHAEDDANRRCLVTAPLPAGSSATMATILGLRAGSGIANVNLCSSMVDAVGQYPARPLRNRGGGASDTTESERQPALPSCVRRHMGALRGPTAPSGWSVDRRNG